MEKTFVIGWKSKDEPRWGQGKKLFTREEAETLADEMNQDYPAFIHDVVNTVASVAAPVAEPELAVIEVDFRSAPEVAIPVAEEAQAAVIA